MAALGRKVLVLADLHHLTVLHSLRHRHPTMAEEERGWGGETSALGEQYPRNREIERRRGVLLYFCPLGFLYRKTSVKSASWAGLRTFIWWGRTCWSLSCARFLCRVQLSRRQAARPTHLWGTFPVCITGGKHKEPLRAPTNITALSLLRGRPSYQCHHNLGRKGEQQVTNREKDNKGRMQQRHLKTRSLFLHRQQDVSCLRDIMYTEKVLIFLKHQGLFPFIVSFLKWTSFSFSFRSASVKIKKFHTSGHNFPIFFCLSGKPYFFLMSHNCND